VTLDVFHRAGAAGGSLADAVQVAARKLHLQLAGTDLALLASTR
jgi:hypothetical protein